MIMLAVGRNIPVMGRQRQLFLPMQPAFRIVDGYYVQVTCIRAEVILELAREKLPLGSGTAEDGRGRLI